jgi:hypothetical protein
LTNNKNLLFFDEPEGEERPAEICIFRHLRPGLTSHEARRFASSSQKATSDTPEIFPVNAEIGARWDTRVIKVDYRYSAFKGDRFDIGAALGLFVLRVDTGLGATEEGDALVSDSNKTAPLPMIGLDVEYEIADRWIVKGMGQYFGLTLDDTLDGNWYEIRAAVEWVPLQNFGVGVGYNFTKVDIAVALDEGRVAEFDYNYRINGPHVYAIAVF